MPFDGSGTYAPPSSPTFPAVSGTTISSGYYNAVINDISSALNNCLTRDGQGKPSGAINWNGQDLTNIGTLGFADASVVGDATSALFLIQNSGAGDAAITGVESGLGFTAAGMDTTNKYTPMIKFGSTDPQFTTTNPKYGAGIVGEATEAYGADTDGGMALSFLTSPNNPGTGHGLTETMRLDENGNLSLGISSGDGKFHAHSGSAGAVTANTGSNVGVFEANADNGISILTPAANEGRILFGSPTSNARGSVRYDHATDLLSLYAGGLEAFQAHSGGIAVGDSLTGSATAAFNVEDTVPILRIYDKSGVATGYSQINCNNSNSSIVIQADDGNNDANSYIGFDVDGAEKARIDAGGNFLVGTTSGDGLAHFQTSTAGSVTANTSANELILESGANCGLSILCPAANNGIIYFGSPTSPLQGGITYSHSTDEMMFRIGNAVVFTLDSNGSITDTTNVVDGPGYKGLPANAKTGGYTLALSDLGKIIPNTTGGWAIPANGTTAFPIGSTIVLYNNSASSQNITITTDTLRLAGTTSTGTRAVAARGLATLVKVNTTEWVVSGPGVS